jgi:hypothetical protein
MPVRYASRKAPVAAAGSEAPASLPFDHRVVYEWVPDPAGSTNATPTPAHPAPRSHAAAFVAIALLLIGSLLVSWTILLPAFLALLLFSAGLSFVSARINPLSIGFYLTTKPSWSAIGVIFLSGALLLALTYEGWKHGWGPIFPQHPWPTL